MARILITGGAGFFGTVLKHRLLDEGFECWSVDLCRDSTEPPGFTPIVGDISDRSVLEPIFGEGRFDAVFRCASLLAQYILYERVS